MPRKKAIIEGVAAGTPLAKEDRHMAENHMAENEVETILAAGDAAPVIIEDPVIPPVEEIQSEPAVLSIVNVVEESISESRIEPEAAIIEAVLTDDSEVLKALADEGSHGSESFVGPFTRSFLRRAMEATNEYSKTCLEKRAAFAGALLSAKSFENALRIQNSYAKSAYTQSVAHFMKMSSLYWNCLGEASKPVGHAVTKAEPARKQV